jgi:sugar transferase (PEP-CTERM/EpsH1 system associated)
VKILVVTDSLPYPLNTGPRIRIYNLIQRMATRHQIWLASLLTEPDESQALAHLEEFCQQVITSRVERGSPLSHLPGMIRFALEGIPLELKFQYSPELFAKIRDLVTTEDLDIVQIEQMRMAQYLRALPDKGRFKRVLMLYDIDFAQAARMVPCERTIGAKLRTGLHSLMMRHWEPRWVERFDCCVTVSEIDRQLLRSANPRVDADVVPNGVDTRLYTPLPEAQDPHSLLFIGNMSYLPCIDAMLYFTSEILPLIRHQVPDVKLWIVGKDPAPEIISLASEHIYVTGRVEDIVPYYQRTQVSVVPLRSGGGTRLKVLESMALGRPIVSTTIGCEGIDAIHGKHLLIADRPDEYAAQTVRLLQDTDLRTHLTDNARQLVEQHYDWDILTQKLMRIYDDMLASPAAQESRGRTQPSELI